MLATVQTASHISATGDLIATTIDDALGWGHEIELIDGTSDVVIRTRRGDLIHLGPVVGIVADGAKRHTGRLLLSAALLGALIASPVAAATVDTRGPVGRDTQTYRDGSKPTSPSALRSDDARYLRNQMHPGRDPNVNYTPGGQPIPWGD